MTLEEIKQRLAKLTLSPETKTEIDRLVAQAEATGLTPEIKEEMAQLVEAEGEASQAEAELYEDFAMALEEFTSEIEKSAEIANDQLDDISQKFDQDTQDTSATK